MQIFENFDLKKITSFKIGGKASYLIIIKNIGELEQALEFAHNKNLKPYIHGGGSNVLFEDAEFKNVFIWIQIKEIKIENKRLTVGAGCSWTELSRYCKENKITGIEGLLTIPGTIGGAVYGNAGAFGQETLNFIDSVKVYNKLKKCVETIPIEKISYQYRHSSFKSNKHLIIISASFDMQKFEQTQTLDSLKEKRDSKQPKGLTTGSFFKNPEGDYAGRLIEAAGLKGKQVGGARISDKHANFFMNEQNASFDDIIKLKKLCQKTVENKFNIKLEPEVQILLAKDLK